MDLFKLSKIENLDWNKNIDEAMLTLEFARANQKEGEVYITKEGVNKAIITIKKKVSIIFSRAQIYTNSENEKFLSSIIEWLNNMGVPYARIGNNMFGLNNKIILKNSKIIERHTFILDLTKTEEEIWKNFNKKLRNAIRKAEKEKVEVLEIKNEKDLKKYYKLSLETEKYIKRVKEKKTFSLQSFEFFKELWINGLGKFFIAKYKSEIIAGTLFLVWKNKSIYFHSCLSREYSDKQTPSLIHWEAIKIFKKDGIKNYDFGGVTLGLGKNDSRYFVYEFKRKFNGNLKEFYNIEITLSPVKKKLQDTLIKLIYRN